MTLDDYSYVKLKKAKETARRAKGRSDDPNRTTITPEQVETVRKMNAALKTQYEIAKVTGLSQTCVSDILRRRREERFARSQDTQP